MYKKKDLCANIVTCNIFSYIRLLTILSIVDKPIHTLKQLPFINHCLQKAKKLVVLIS